MNDPLQVYLAGPDVFRLDAVDHGQALKNLCHKYGFTGVYPSDAAIENINLDPWKMAKEIFEANIDLIRDCDAMIANLVSFRGPNMDAGTAFEIGYATALGKAVIGYTADNRDYIEKVTEFYNGDVTHEGNEWRDPNLNLVEDFGEPENLMISCSVTDVVDDFEGALKLLVNIGLKPGQYVGVKRHQLRSDMTRAPIGALVISCGGC